jgi:nucleoside-diphosphate kinase
MEKSLVIIKPDGVGKKIIGSIISRFENEELYISNLKMIRINRELACRHYHEHEGKPFFERLINYVTADRSVVMIVEGEDAIKKVRDIMGSTDPLKAEAGTIRGDFGTDITINVVHGSDSLKSAEREINLFFGNGVV